MIYDKLNNEQLIKVHKLEKSKYGDLSIIDRNINIENEKYVVIECIKHRVKTGDKMTYGYYYIIMCKHCGYIKKVYKSDFSKQITCKICDLHKYYTDFVGFENIAYKVIDFDHACNKKLYYKCICKNCNSTLILRKDSIMGASKCHCVKCKGNGIVPSLDGPLNVYKYNYKMGAFNRGLTWELTDDEFKQIISQPCYYCGELPHPIQSLRRYTHVKDELYVNGIDRLNSDDGYTISNSVPCCSMCNKMKLDFSLDKFILQVKKIALNYKCPTTIENTSDKDGSE